MDIKPEAVGVLLEAGNTMDTNRPVRPGVTVIVPAFNEEGAIEQVIRDLMTNGRGVATEVIVVDDGSLDSTAAVASAAGARVVTHPRNMGYGASLKTGIRLATTEFVMTFDGDGQHQAEDLARLWEQAAFADMVVGQRTRLIHSPLWRMPGKWMLTAMSNYLANERIPDLNSGLRLIRRDVALKYLHVCPRGFSFSTTITLAFLNRGWRVVYVPIVLRRRLGTSTITVRTGLETVVLLLRIVSLFDPLRVFVPLSAAIAAIGVAWGIPYAVNLHGISVGSMLAIVTAVLLFGLGLLCDQISQLRLERFE